jgi:hypothetical protein
MAFTVYLSSDEAFNHSYGDNDVYNFLPSGYLKSNQRRAEVFTYAGWVYLKADAGHDAGGVKGRQQRATTRATKT